MTEEEFAEQCRRCRNIEATFAVWIRTFRICLGLSRRLCGGPAFAKFKSPDSWIDGRRGFLGWVRQQAAGARCVFPVCTGALICGAAGLLKGRRATTHWASFHLLPFFGAIPVNERVVVDRNWVFAAGVDGFFSVTGRPSVAILVTDKMGCSYQVQEAKEGRIGKVTEFRRHLRNFDCLSFD